MDMLINLIVVISLQHTHISNNHCTNLDMYKLVSSSKKLKKFICIMNINGCLKPLVEKLIDQAGNTCTKGSILIEKEKPDITCLLR